MSTDLDLRQNLPKIRIGILRVTQTSEACSSGSNDENGVSVIQNHEVENNDSDDCQTPTSEENKIPAILSCPPAPRKPRMRTVSCKRKLSEFDFFEIVNREEVESFFRSSFEAVAKRRRPM